jgi:hypothetical protein
MHVEGEEPYGRTRYDWSLVLKNLPDKGTWVSIIMSYRVGPKMVRPLGNRRLW